ncbi:hypothetical protein L6452_28403 [Arctium lappa]|uniref:Uncharacterized protein n=1 Tax=Arctium lappa TaxID=4217 RepID=A0ACB9A2P0_ARCLA|nr:hypothetical protein L6452_28403 [Arctium lappa]
MNSSTFSLVKTPWIISFLIPIFSFACGDFTLFIITSLVLISFAFFLKQNPQVLDHEQQQQSHQEDEHVLDHGSDQNNDDSNHHHVVDEVIKKGCLEMGSPDSYSESEIIDQFSCTTEDQDSDFDGWQFSGETYRRADCSDGSISDEESLIEIALPGGHYVGYKDEDEEEEMKLCCRKKSPESVLWWPEMNEEENMIEIDISVGSIKCSRFEIKA